MNTPFQSIRLAVVFLCLFGLACRWAFAEVNAISAANITTSSPAPTLEVDPLVKASAYGDKSVWSYAGHDPLPWTIFHPHDFGSAKIVFNAEGVTPVGTVPAPGIHPRIFFSPEDLPAIRQRIKEDPAAQAAWKDVLSYSHVIRNDYDEKADYAQPDWAKGSFRIHGRTDQLMRLGGYGKNREDYFGLLASGKPASKRYGERPSGFFFPAAIEAFRCLIDNDVEGAKKLASAVETSVKLEQTRRAKIDKPVLPGQPPHPSTPRYDCCNLGLVYDFIYNWMTPDQQRLIHDELVLLSSYVDGYGTFNNAEAGRSNWATFSYEVWDNVAIEGEPGFNELKFLGLYRGWRDFFTYSFFKSGAAYEGEGKLLFGMDAIVAFDRIAPKYNLPLLSEHPLVRAHYGEFTALSVLPTQDKFAIFDILGGMGGGLTTPQDVVVAHYLFPKDPTVDFVYRVTVGDDYRMLPMPGHSWNNLITDAIFATALNPANTPEKLNLPLTFFCGQRAMLMTRSSWDKNATFLTMHVRGASGGHPYRDRNGIMLAGQGRSWITIPVHNGETDGRVCNTVLIDGADQSNTTPGRVVDFVDMPLATFAVGDSKYCWDWVWSTATKTLSTTNAEGKSLEGKELTQADIEKGNVEIGPSWKPVEQSFNDFAYTKSDYKLYQDPIKYVPAWNSPDGVYTCKIRQVNTPVLKSFRTAGVVRGPHPYVLVVDDIQRDCLPTRYDLNLNLFNDLVPLKAPLSGTQSNDLVMVSTNSIDASGALKPGEPALLIRMLDQKGTSLPPKFTEIDKQNILTLSTKAVAPDFKLLLYPFKSGNPLPSTSWDANKTQAAIEFPDQKDMVLFTPSQTSGKTDLKIMRNGAEIVSVNAPVPKLNDPDSDALTAQLNKLPETVASMKLFDPNTLPGLVASWSFNQLTNGTYPATQTNIAAVPATGTTVEPGITGNSVGISTNGLTVPLNLKPLLPAGMTFSFWVKATEEPRMGTVVNVNGNSGFVMELIQGNLNFATLRKSYPISASVLTAWTHYAVTWDGNKVILYCNGMPLMKSPVTGKLSFSDKFTLAGGNYGGFSGNYEDLRIYNHALDADTIQKIHLWGATGR